ncbi:MAG TPA: hypothetical protein PKZ99_10075, partial [Azospirillaceae bacterium]|nr:hypothetical protein [Azospirillaceae bacterium]
INFFVRAHFSLFKRGEWSYVRGLSQAHVPLARPRLHPLLNADRRMWLCNDVTRDFWTVP